MVSEALISSTEVLLEKGQVENNRKYKEDWRVNSQWKVKGKPGENIIVLCIHSGTLNRKHIIEMFVVLKLTFRCTSFHRVCCLCRAPQFPFMLWLGAALFTLGHEKGSAHFDDSYSQEVVDTVNELDLAQFGWVGADESIKLGIH